MAAAPRPGTYLLLWDSDVWHCQIVTAVEDITRVALRDYNGEESIEDLSSTGGWDWFRCTKHGSRPRGTGTNEVVWFDPLPTAEQKAEWKTRGIAALQGSADADTARSGDAGKVWVNVSPHAPAFGSLLEHSDLPESEEECLRAGAEDALLDTGDDGWVHLRLVDENAADDVISKIKDQLLKNETTGSSAADPSPGLAQSLKSELPAPGPLPTCDPRILPFGSPSNFEKTAAELQDRELDPRTMPHFPYEIRAAQDVVLRMLEPSAGGSIMGHHRMWLADSGIGPNRRERIEHKVLCEILHQLVVTDRFVPINSAGIEALMRRLQVLEQAVYLNPNAPDYSGADYLSGTDGIAKSGALLDPLLLKHVAAQKEAQRKLNKCLTGGDDDSKGPKGPKEPWWKNKKKGQGGQETTK
jgi:hypothetical protein